MKDFKYKKVVVIMGGNSAEREISLLSGNAVLKSLKKSEVNVYAFDPKDKNLCELVKHGYDCAVIMLHGRGGEDGTIQGALEYFKIPYTGSGVLASSIAIDKYKTKLIWHHHGIPMPKDQVVVKKDYNNHKFVLKLDLPVVVKPVCEGSTVGLSKVYDIENLATALDLAFNYDDMVLIEELIIGSEYTVTILNDVVYPVVKIEAVAGEFDYNNKYFTGTTEYICPYDFGDELNQKIKQYTQTAYDSIGATGVARLDFMLNQKNEVFFLELNTIPGMTNHSLVPKAFKAIGKSFDELCLEIVNNAGLHLK
ncbi:MAG: D-alanine--D-alanine ligase [Burkholderiales bacterium]|nr:D-alanine--D-alanine ligase [Burkholderiales bacterium]